MRVMAKYRSRTAASSSAPSMPGMRMSETITSYGDDENAVSAAWPPKILQTVEHGLLVVDEQDAARRDGRLQRFHGGRVPGSAVSRGRSGVASAP
jgi:hypothetical protein